MHCIADANDSWEEAKGTPLYDFRTSLEAYAARISTPNNRITAWYNERYRFAELIDEKGNLIAQVSPNGIGTRMSISATSDEVVDRIKGMLPIPKPMHAQVTYQ